MKFGIAPGGRHLYPAFPYTSYQRMRIGDLLDLKAFLDTLPPVAKPSLPHALPFPFTIRRGIGLWQLLYVDGKTFQPDPARSAEENRGAYLVEGPAHCGECHTPRNWIGGPVPARAYGGGPAPEGMGKIPNITTDATGLADWSADDIDTLLSTGFKPNFDSVGSTMAAVVRNTAKLSDADRKAIAAYVADLPPVNSGIVGGSLAPPPRIALRSIRATYPNPHGEVRATRLEPRGLILRGPPLAGTFGLASTPSPSRPISPNGRPRRSPSSAGSRRRGRIPAAPCPRRRA